MKSEPVNVIKGIGPVYQNKLNEIGIFSTNDLLNKTLKSEERRKFFSQTDLSLGDLKKWSGIASLMLINGIGAKNAALLTQAGINNAGQLANANAFSLTNKLETTIPEEGKKKVTSIEIIQSWIEESKTIVTNLQTIPSSLSHTISPGSFHSINSYLNDLIEFENWKGLSQFGTYSFWEAIKEINRINNNISDTTIQLPSNSLPEKNKKLSPADTEIIKTFLLELGKPTEAVNKFIKGYNSNKYEIPDLDLKENTKEYWNEKIRFAVFLGMLGIHCILTSNVKAGKSNFLQTKSVENSIDFNTLFKSLNQVINKQQENFEEVTNSNIKKLNSFISNNNYEELKKEILTINWSLETQIKELANFVNTVLSIFPDINQTSAQHQELLIRTNQLVNQYFNLIATGLLLLAIAPKGKTIVSCLFKNELEDIKNSISKAIPIPKNQFKLITKATDLQNFLNKQIKITGIVKHTFTTRTSNNPEFIIKNEIGEFTVKMEKIIYKEILPDEGSLAEISGILKKQNEQYFVIIAPSIKEENRIINMYKNPYSLYESNISGTQLLQFPKTIKNLTQNYWRI